MAPTDTIIESFSGADTVVEIIELPTVVEEIVTAGPQGPRGADGFIALQGNTPVPPDTPAGTVILRY